MIARIKTGQLKERNKKQQTTTEEPMLDLVHGLPGTGKTQLIKWIRELFKEELKWTHGVQFIFLAFQNSAVAKINGYTIHHWSGIPLGKHGVVPTNFRIHANAFDSLSSTKSVWSQPKL